ncbi:Cystinosin -like protein [Trichinella pseudospiralis]|uniref:Cystinosin homolog n=2 Tax=Trichinella pseudospiralis TaxID=6337 RepID=A0A0V0XUP9_TRIPS|nr:Cystinosin -like protein [Trichinella pseudospiralis]
MWLLVLLLSTYCIAQNVDFRENITNVRTVDDRCLQLPDGNHAIQACSHTYLACSSGRSFVYSCPETQVYEPKSNRCMAAGHIPECGGVAPTTTSIPVLETDAPVYPVECKGFPPGDRPLKPQSCSTQYYSCLADGRGVVRKCPSNLYFDPKELTCNYFNFIVACVGSSPEITYKFETETWPTLPPVDFDCYSKEDGFYDDARNPCSSVYYACTGDLARLLHCENNLVFDVETQSCQAPQETYACTGKRRTTTTPRPDPNNHCSGIFYSCTAGTGTFLSCPERLYFDIETTQCLRFDDVFACSGKRKTTTPSTSSTTTPKRKPVAFDCSTLPDGLYPTLHSACSNYYYVCSGSVALELQCPTGLFYDPDQQFCTTYGTIFACTGVVVSTETITSTSIPPTTPQPLFNCADKQSGIYKDPSNRCSPVYFQCSNGHTYQYHCPENLFFSPESELCDRFEEIYECTGVKKTTTPTIKTTTVKPEVVPFDCRSLPNGDYPDQRHRCSKEFFSCSSGVATRRRCPSTTFFDPELLQCFGYDNVPACSNKPRTTTVPTTTTHHIASRKNFFDCTGKPSTNYPIGVCEQAFVSCIDEVSVLIECPAGLKYDEEMDECNHAYYIPDCGGRRITTSLPQIANSTTNFEVAHFNCTHLVDGRYADVRNPCPSNIFYVCSGARALLMMCPYGLFYDPKLKLCNYRRKIKCTQVIYQIYYFLLVSTLVKYFEIMRMLTFLVIFTLIYWNLSSGEVEEDAPCLHLKFQPNVINVPLGSESFFTVQLSQPSEKVYNVSFEQQDPKSITLNKTAFQIPAKSQEIYSIGFTANALKASVAVRENRTTEQCISLDSLKESMILITVFRLEQLNVLLDVLGWIYFAAWTISFWPQIFLNFKRKSVVGLNFDFLALNITGFLFYASYNCSLYFSPVVQTEYLEQYPNSVNPVLIQDVAFALHAFFATVLTIGQCFFYERGSQKLSKLCLILLIAFWSSTLITLLLAAVRVITWLWFVSVLSYVKLAISILKYIPQAVLNYRRKNTEGFSIGSIFLDFTGGVGSMFQMIVFAYNTDEWSQLFGDFTKFGLGLFSICFDIVFFIQRYALYRNYQKMDMSEESEDSQVEKY